MQEYPAPTLVAPPPPVLG